MGRGIVVTTEGNLTLWQMRSGSKWEDLAGRFVNGSRGEGTFRNTMELVRSGLACKSIVVEEKYICRDYRDEYSYFYSKSFQEHSSYCTRLHFFSNRLATLADVGEADGHYLGYMVVRPLPVRRVGRTVLSVPRPLAQGGSFHGLCATTYEVHIGSHTLSFRGTPFIQQDGMVQVCAHAAMWTSARYLSKRDGIQPFLPSEINRFVAEHSSSRDVPAESVLFEEMAYGLKRMGLSPLPLIEDDSIDEDEHYLSRDELFAASYCYLESGVPLILASRDHAVTAVGHTLGAGSERADAAIDRLRATDEAFQKANDGERVPAILYSDAWVDGLVVQDDAEGPFRVLPRADRDAENLKSIFGPKMISGNGSFMSNFNSVLVPLPSSIFLVEAHIKAEIENMLVEQRHRRALHPILEKAMDIAGSNPLVMRLYFTKAVDYKAAVREQLSDPDSGISKQLVLAYEKLPMPQYVWVCEITTRELFCQEDKRILGEVLIDAKAHKDERNKYVAIHALETLLTVDRSSGTRDPVFLDDFSGPYRHHPRRIY